MTGADTSLTALLVVLTGIFGSTCSQTVLQKLKVSDPVSVGLSVGASSHGIGTATLSKDPVKFSASIISMTLTGLWTVVLLALPSFRNILVGIARP